MVQVAIPGTVHQLFTDVLYPASQLSAPWCGAVESSEVVECEEGTTQRCDHDSRTVNHTSYGQHCSDSTVVSRVVALALR